MGKNDIVSIGVHNKTTGVIHVDGVYHDTNIQDQVRTLLDDVGHVVKSVQIETANRVYYIEIAPNVE